MSSKKIVSLLPPLLKLFVPSGLKKTWSAVRMNVISPISVKQLPVCSEANFPDGLSSSAIDNKVKELLSDALSVYTVNREMIKALPRMW